ncbi:MAG: DUF3795 domain-containing protein [Anaerolineaceae bacterium]
MTKDLTNPTLIATCGINCRLCMAYGREKKACPGCRADDTNKSKSCISCRIKNCDKLAKGAFEYCFGCDDFPCALLAHLDKRYRTKYGASPIDNLNAIRKNGIDQLVESENIKWICPECGAMICMHKPQCLSCGYVWRQ